MGLSVSPDVPAEISEIIRQALVNANNSEAGKAMLAALKIEKFDPASSETYDGYSDLLKDVFGY
jgi:ABC-type phosphate/phosphonate transport system substrate-binding protein